jgi:hypothetical protein
VVGDAKADVLVDAATLVEVVLPRPGPLTATAVRRRGEDRRTAIPSAGEGSADEQDGDAFVEGDVAAGAVLGRLCRDHESIASNVIC